MTFALKILIDMLSLYLLSSPRIGHAEDYYLLLGNGDTQFVSILFSYYHTPCTLVLALLREFLYFEII